MSPHALSAALESRLGVEHRMRSRELLWAHARVPEVTRHSRQPICAHWGDYLDRGPGGGVEAVGAHR